MNCRDFRTAHLEYTDRTLSTDRLVEARAHVDACADCSRFDALVRRSLMLAHSLPPITPGPRYDPRLTARIARDRGTARHYLVTMTGLLAAASAAFVVGILSAALLFRHGSGSVGALPPVVAMATPPAPEALPGPASQHPPLMRADFMAGASGGIPLWSAASLIDEAPARFVTAQFTSAAPAR